MGLWDGNFFTLLFKQQIFYRPSFLPSIKQNVFVIEMRRSNPIEDVGPSLASLLKVDF